MKSIETQIAAIEEAIQRGREGERLYLIKVCAKYEINLDTLERWMKKVKGLPRAEWETALAPTYKGRTVLAEFTPEAWDYFLEQYRTSNSHAIATAYQACLAHAATRGWKVPSKRTIHRRLVKENLILPRRRPLPDFDI